MNIKLFGKAAALAAMVGLLGGVNAFASSPAQDEDAAEFEEEFMMEMIPHHMMAIHMSEMCVERAVHDELRDTCETIVESQTDEVEQMEEWLDEWYGVDAGDHMGMMDQKMHKRHMKEMRKLGRGSDRRFEIRYMEMMIPHHQQAIEMAEECVAKAEHEELRDMCESMIDEQAEEIELFEEWLAEWYGRDGDSGQGTSRGHGMH